MTRPLRSSSDAAGFTRLERTVMDALAAELRDTVPDLARQFAASRPTVRRNSGFGFFTEMAVDPALARDGVTGDLGTVHAMVGALPDPIAFTARLQNGRLVGLMGSSYGQDTRAIDFATVPFTQVFTLDPSGRSIPVQTAAPAASAPSPRQHRPRPQASVPTTPPAEAEARRVIAQSLKTIFEDPDPREAKRQARPAAPSDAPTPVDKTTLLIGAWTLLIVAAVLAVTVFRVSWIFAFIAVLWGGSALRQPKVVAALQRAVDQWNASAAQRG